MAIQYLGEQDGVALYADINGLFEALREEQQEIEQERQERIGMSARYYCSLPKKKRLEHMRQARLAYRQRQQ